ncbi:signal peptidase II [Peptacetobacter sp.]|uniref:signal peptidase II n=1 Tax=Peptacetobacter sp. TaxID=2991975 RepID=UPI0026331855|nr:signal peptidase II [Peptacetobacter sp.]
MIYEIIIVILIAIDQIIKFGVLEFLKEKQSISIIPNIFHLTYVENRGAAFGMFQNSQIIFVLIAIIATIVGLYWIHKNDNINKIGKSAVIMIISGAIGNLTDRVRLGFVVDYFDFRIIWQYVFNFADILVVCGTILLCFYILKYADTK